MKTNSKIPTSIEDIIKAVFDNTCGTYRDIFEKYLPTNNIDNNRATGFTERNLTFNFCHNYLDLYKDKGVVWQEMPIIGQSHQHIDSVIVHSDTQVDTLFLIEAKRLHSPYHYEELISEKAGDEYTTRQHKTDKSGNYGDLHRLRTHYKDIPIYNSLKTQKECYAILLADFLIQQGKNKQSKNRVDKYYSLYQKNFDKVELIFKDANMEYYLYYKVEPLV